MTAAAADTLLMLAEVVVVEEEDPLMPLEGEQVALLLVVAAVAVVVVADDCNRGWEESRLTRPPPLPSPLLLVFLGMSFSFRLLTGEFLRLDCFFSFTTSLLAYR